MSITNIARLSAYGMAIAMAIGGASLVHADGFVPYKIELKRTNPNNPIPQSSIMGVVKDKWDGRILSVTPDLAGGDDCHIVNFMGTDGEFRIVHVACSK